MSSSDIAICVRGIGKSYTIRHDAPKHTTLGDALIDRLHHPFRRPTKETFWALKDVSFDIKKGEVVGIIGRNGAGKSTLLKILSRITAPTEGEIDLFGRVGSLLEVGTGFHQELTGRENIFLNGAILGMSRPEIKKQFDAIVDFAGVEQFLDTPVKRYSSGMYVRLAFAVAAHLRSEILIVDEVLAVGDAEFQQKCLGKMKAVSAGGRTVLFVSHNMQSVRILCDSALLLASGYLVTRDSVEYVLREYHAGTTPTSALMATVSDEARRPGSGEYRFTAIRAKKGTFICNEEKSFAFRLEKRRGDLGSFFLGAHILDESGLLLLHCDSRMVCNWLRDCDMYEGEFTFHTPWLKPGKYRLDLYIGAGGFVDHFEHACSFEVADVLPYPNAAQLDATARGVMFADFNFALSVPATPDRKADLQAVRSAIEIST